VITSNIISHPTFITSETKQQPEAKYPLTFGYQTTSAKKEPPSDGTKTQPETKARSKLERREIKQCRNSQQNNQIQNNTKRQRKGLKLRLRKALERGIGAP
jgi:hypothetical protein